jgi:hypothetical protein
MFTDIANDAVWTDAIFPETGHIFPKGIAKTTRVIIRGDSIPQIAQNQGLRLPIQLAQFFSGPIIEFNPPDHSLAPALPKTRFFRVDFPSGGPRDNNLPDLPDAP